MIKLYYYPSYISMLPHILLHELNVDHRLIFVDCHANAQKRPEFLALNPNGLVPVMQHGDLVLFEAAAISMYLVDHFPDPPLAPAVGTEERAHFYKWMMWLATNLHPALSNYLHPRKWTDDEAAQVKLREGAEERVAALFGILDAELKDRTSPWLVGNSFSVVDAYAFVLCRWSRRMEHPGSASPNFGPYAKRVAERPAVQKALAAEHLAEPWL